MTNDTTDKTRAVPFIDAAQEADVVHVQFDWWGAPPGGHKASYIMMTEGRRTLLMSVADALRFYAGQMDPDSSHSLRHYANRLEAMVKDAAPLPKYFYGNAADGKRQAEK
jgi:hypothetical protein